MHIRRIFISLFTIFALIASTFVFAQEQRRRATQQDARGVGLQGTIKQLPANSKRYALVIGIDEYRDRQISRLTGATNDAKRLKDALVQYAGFPEDQVILLASDQPEERQPTRINILSYLSNIGGQVPRDGLLLVSFAGHGIERGGQAYLIPSDARLSNDVSLLEESALSVTRMKDRIRATGVGQVLVLLDACRNDPGGRGDADNNLTNAYTRGFNFDVRNKEVTAFATIYATTVGKRAYEYTEKEQGYFTWALVEGLKGAAANEQGEVTLAGLVRYLQERVPKQVALDLGQGKEQRPFAVIEGYRADELVITVTVTVRRNPSMPNAPTVSVLVIDPAVGEQDYWARIKESKDAEDFREYLKEYPSGRYAAMARLMVRRLTTNTATNAGSNGTAGNNYENRTYSSEQVAKNAVITYTVEPGRTEQARRNGTTGTVRVRMLLKYDGTVTNITAMNQLPDGLTDQAVAAAKQVRFIPAQKDGRAVSQWIVIEYNFILY